MSYYQELFKFHLYSQYYLKNIKIMENVFVL